MNAPRETFPCGHERTLANSVQRAVRKDGSIRYGCRDCKNFRKRAARASKPKPEKPPRTLRPLFIALNVSVEEKTALLARALEAEMSLAAYVRLILFGSERGSA